jgi:thiol-disulfide isomerase/thioredoxin
VFPSCFVSSLLSAFAIFPARCLEAGGVDKQSICRHPAHRAAVTPLGFALLGLLGVAAWGYGYLPIRTGEATIDHRDFKPVDAVLVRDLSGRLHRVGGKSSSAATVVVFLSTTCPISRAYLPLLRRLAEEADRRGVPVVGVVTEPGLSDAALQAFVVDFELTFPIVDERSVGEGVSLRNQLLPTHVPEAFVIDGSGRVCYRGRIDDRYPDVGQRRREVRQRDLVRAIDRVLSGRATGLVRTVPVGCLIEPVRPRGEKVSQRTWSSDVAALVHARCTHCHRPGTAAPFPLQTYDHVADRSRQILDVVRRGIMPPWKPRAGFGHFQDEQRLTESERSVLVSWIGSGMSRGDPAVAPPPPRFPGGWTLGPPDLVLQMQEPVQVPAEGPAVYWYFVIPTGLTRDRMIAAIDFRAGNPQLVHHASFRFDDTGAARRLDAADPLPGYRRFGGWGFSSGGTLGGWAVGVQPRRLDPGLGRPIRAGSDLVLQVHYQPVGRREQDQSQLGVYFLPEVDDGTRRVSEVVELFVGELDLEIPAGEAQWYHRAEYTLPVDVTVHMVMPHMHLLGRRCLSQAHTPGGKVIPLVAIDEWDFNWQAQFHPRRAIRLVAGTRLVHEVWYDNSESNPFNPHVPARLVRWGEGTHDEMGLLLLDVTTDTPAQQRRLLAHNRAVFARQRRRIGHAG